MVRAYAELSGDFNPLHVDEAYAATTQFGRTIAHGPVALGLAAGILGTKLPGPGSIAISNYVRYRAPMFVGEPVTTRVEVAAIDRERRRATLAVTWRDDDGTLLCEGEVVIRPPGL